VSLDRALDYGKPEPTAPLLSGDEGIEQSVTNLRRYPGPLIAHEDRVRPSSELGLALRKLMRGQLSPLQNNLAIRR